MEARTLRRDRVQEFVDALAASYEVIAPRDDLVYGRLESGDELGWGPAGSPPPPRPARPLKEFFFPDRETLLRYALSGREIRVDAPPQEVRRRVVIGAPPCDVAALGVLDPLFSWDYLDATYLRRREGTAIVALACVEPEETCFCTSVGGSPAGTEGADVLLTPLEDVYHVGVITDRGQALVEEWGALFGPVDGATERLRAEVLDAGVARVSRRVDVDGLREALRFESDAWHTAAEQCVDCGVCTFLCPTCHCFDIQDEGTPEAGGRIRLWDSCAFRSFTRTAVHEPRPTHASRYRQRILHKFQYYPQNFQRTLCVGCGRCIRHCPQGVDITAELSAVRG